MLDLEIGLLGKSVLNHKVSFSFLSDSFHGIVHIPHKTATMYLFCRFCLLQRNSAYMAQMAFYEEVWKNNPGSVGGAAGSGGTVCSYHWSMHVHQKMQQPHILCFLKKNNIFLYQPVFGFVCTSNVIYY